MEEISVYMGHVIRRENARPCQVYQDVSILDSTDKSNNIPIIHHITFHNYYVYNLIVQQHLSGGDYVTILDGKQLMKSPNLETGCQSQFTINTFEFNEHYIPGKAFRMILVQPSTLWTKYELRNVKFFSLPSKSESKEIHDSITTSSNINDINSIFSLLGNDMKTIQSAPLSTQSLVTVPLTNFEAEKRKKKERKLKKANSISQEEEHITETNDNIYVT